MQPAERLVMPPAVAAPARWPRALFVLSALGGSAIFWLATHPPMVDLAQHGGQVMLLRDLVFGAAHWDDVVRLNWFTPYLIGYVLALPLSLVVPVATALKLLLSIAYLSFVWMCLRLRQHFAADARLDWLFLVPFFGLPYKWGFFTFLVAAPIALGMVLLSSRYALSRSPARGLGVVAAGLLLLASHGLAFVFGYLVGGALLAAQWWRRRFSVAAFLPFVVLGLACLGYFVVSRSVEADFNVPYDYIKPDDWGLVRLRNALLYTVGQQEDMELLPFATLLFAAPWLLGLRPSRARALAGVPFLIVAAIMIGAPSFALNTAFLYERFALFMLPAYAWMFAPATGRAPPGRHRRWGSALALVLMVASCWLLLAVHAQRAWHFGQEAGALDAAMRRLEPHERALILVFNGASDAARNPFLYVHYPAWYQAEREGLVDFNFAWFPPQIVRFRPQRLPPILPGFEWAPETFDWRRHRGADYRYIFVRHFGPVPDTLFRGAACAPVARWSSGPWTIYERGDCR